MDMMARGMAQKNTSQLSDITTLKGLKTVNQDPNFDNAPIINEAIQNTISGQVLLPFGTYKISGIVNTGDVNIKGMGKSKTTLVNTSTVNPVLKIQNGRCTISDLTIKGDGTQNYGANATTSDGILIDGSAGDGCSYVNIDNVRVCNHGQNGIRFTGGCWIINITRSQLEQNKLDGVKIDGTDGYNLNSGQKNIINVDKSILNGNGKNGILVWGTIINITKCTIEANRHWGVSLSAYDLDNAFINNSGTSTINIKENYFENSGYGHIGILAVKTINGSNTYYNGIEGVVIDGNYFYQNTSNFTSSYDSMIYSDSINDDELTTIVRSIYIQNNHYTGTACCVNMNNKTNYDSFINLPYSAYYNNAFTALYKNLGRMNVKNKLKEIVVSGYFYCKGVTYSTFIESDNITANTTVYFPIQLSSEVKFDKIKLYVDTDSTNYNIDFRVYYRDPSNVNAYSQLLAWTGSNKSGSQLFATSNADYASPLGLITNVKNDLYMKITITLTTAGTKFKLGNPIVSYWE